MIGDKMKLADAIFGNDGNDGARRVTATATGDSSNGKVTVEFADGETAEVGTIAPVSEGQKVAMVLQDGQATVIGADGWGEKVEATADATATLVRAYEDGVLVCKTGNTVGALVNADGSFDVRSVTWDGDTPTASSVLASFDDNGLSFAGDGDSFLHHDADNGGLQLYGMKYNALRTYVKEETQASVEAVGLNGTPEVVLDAHNSNAVQTTVTVKPDGIVIFDSSKLVVDGSTGTVTDDGCRKLADWITDSRIETAGVWAIPQSTTKQTAINTTGWSYELYASGKVHMWGIVANGSAACTQLSNGVYRETANQYIALPVKVRYIRAMTYGSGLPGFAFAVRAVPADYSTGYWSDSGVIATGYRFVADASGTYSAAATIDIWAQV